MSTSLTILDVALASAALLGGAVALLTRDRRVQVMGFLVLGVVVTVVWLRLGSVDVGLAEAGLGGGILGTLLVWLAVRSPRRRDEAGPLTDTGGRPWPRIVIGVASAAGVGLVGSIVWWRVEQSLPTWESGVSQGMEETGVTHEVTGVLLAFRAYDTLLESAVLMLAGVAVLALMRDGGTGRTLSPAVHIPPTLPWAARVSAPVLLLIGLWLLFAGSSDAGGAFQSGAVLCALLILLRVSGISLKTLILRWLRPLLVIGVVVFILMGAIGPLLGDPWLTWEPGWAFAAILTVEVTLTAGIAAGLFLIALALENPDELERAEPLP